MWATLRDGRVPRPPQGEAKWGAGIRLFHFLAAIDAPELVLLHIAGIVVDRHVAPFPVAGKNAAENAGLKLRHGARAGRIGVVEGDTLFALRPRGDEYGAAGAEQAMKYTAVGPIAVAHAPPIVRFGDPLDGEAGTGEYPDDRLVGARPFAHIDLVGLEAH